MRVHLQLRVAFADAHPPVSLPKGPKAIGVPPVGFEPTLPTLLGGQPLPWATGASLGYTELPITCAMSLGTRAIQFPAIQRRYSRARTKIASSISGVTRPVKVFC